MALIICPECSKEISDRVKSCPHCGYPIIEDDSNIQKVEVASVKLDKMNDKKRGEIFKVLISLVLIGVITFVTYNGYQKNKIKGLEEEYSRNLDLIMFEILETGAKAESLLNLTGRVWYNSIYKEHDSETDEYTILDGKFVDDFNLALSQLSLNENTIKIENDIKIGQNEVSKIMRDMKDVPESFDKVYDDLVELNMAFQSVTDFAINPSGNLNSFNDDKRIKIEKVLELHKRINSIRPNI